MTLWFGPFIDVEPAHGYFHVCPSCYEECVAPHIEEIEHTLARLNPAAAAYLERERAADAGRETVDDEEEEGVEGEESSGGQEAG